MKERHTHTHYSLKRTQTHHFNFYLLFKVIQVYSIHIISVIASFFQLYQLFVFFLFSIFLFVSTLMDVKWKCIQLQHTKRRGRKDLWKCMHNLNIIASTFSLSTVIVQEKIELFFSNYYALDQSVQSKEVCERSKKIYIFQLQRKHQCIRTILLKRSTKGQNDVCLSVDER